MSSSCGTFARGAGYWHRRPVPGLCRDNRLGTRTCGQRECVAALGIRFLAPPQRPGSRRLWDAGSHFEKLTS